MKKPSDKEELLINIPTPSTPRIKDDARVDVKIDAGGEDSTVKASRSHSESDEKDFSVRDSNDKNQKTKKKIPLHYWVLGAIVLIPFIIPLIRITEALIMLLIRIFA